MNIGLQTSLPLTAAPGMVKTIQPSDRVLAGLIAQGHGREACAAYLQISEDDLMRQVVEQGLPTPSDAPMRVGHNQTAWGVDAIRRLIDLWTRNLATAQIGQCLDRSAGGVRGKAKWLGLWKRDRKALLTSLPQIIISEPEPAPAEPQASPLAPSSAIVVTVPKRRELVWSEDIERWLADRWLAFQHADAIARDLSAMFGSEVKSSTLSTKAYRLELPRRDSYFLVDSYAPGNVAKHAHLLPKVTERRCKIRGRLFWATGANRTSAEARRQAHWQNLTAGMSDCSLGAMH